MTNRKDNAYSNGKQGKDGDRQTPTMNTKLIESVKCKDLKGSSKGGGGTWITNQTGIEDGTKMSNYDVTFVDVIHK